MAIFNGLEVAIRQDRNNAAEYQDAFCDERTTGNSLYHYISLQPGKPFTLFLHVFEGFMWCGANSLKLRIDFDRGDLVLDTEVYVSQREFMGAFVLQPCDGGYEVEIPRLVRQITAEVEEEFSMKTETFSQVAVPKKPVEMRNQGTIKILVERGNMKRTSRGRPPNFTKPSDLGGLGRQQLQQVGIHTEISLFNCEVRNTQEQFFRFISINNHGQAGLFVFMYRIPEEYMRIQSVELEQANVGQRDRQTPDRTKTRGGSRDAGNKLHQTSGRSSLFSDRGTPVAHRQRAPQGSDHKEAGEELRGAGLRKMDDTDKIGLPNGSTPTQISPGSVASANHKIQPQKPSGLTAEEEDETIEVSRQPPCEAEELLLKLKESEKLEEEYRMLKECQGDLMEEFEMEESGLRTKIVDIQSQMRAQKSTHDMRMQGIRAQYQQAKTELAARQEVSKKHEQTLQQQLNELNGSISDLNNHIREQERRVERQKEIMEQVRLRKRRRMTEEE